MGLFDFLKKKPDIRTHFSNPTQPVEEKSLEERNAEYLAMRDLEIQRLQAAYDFNSIHGIRSIPVPCQEVNGDSSTGRVEYYLKGKCFAEHWKDGRKDLAIACLQKAQELMYVSDMAWKRSDFMSLVKHLHEVGRHEEANAEQKRVEAFFSKEEERMERKIEEDVFASLCFLGTDLIEVGNSGVCCGKCAKYRNRIYSATGKDKRFPLFPEDFHLKCGLRPSPYVWGVNEPSFQCKDIIKYSNRPFKDDRTSEEIERYNSWRSMMEENEEKKKRYEQNQKDYFWLQEHLPELCPKSMSGYSRMKNSNTETFQKIAREAAKLGKVL